MSVLLVPKMVLSRLNITSIVSFFNFHHFRCFPSFTSHFQIKFLHHKTKFFFPIKLYPFLITFPSKSDSNLRFIVKIENCFQIISIKQRKSPKVMKQFFFLSREKEDENENIIKYTMRRDFE